MLCYVYGTLKKGYGNHHILANSTFLGTEILTFKGRMYDVGFPVLMKSREKISVEGELYNVDTATFRRLDRLESEGTMYKRRRKRLEDGRMVYYYQGMNKFWRARAYGRPVHPDSDNVIRWRRS